VWQWQCAWECESGEVVRVISRRKFWNVRKFFPRCHNLIVVTKLLSVQVWHKVSRMSWTVRNLCVTDYTTWHDMSQTMCLVAVLTDFVPMARIDTPYCVALLERNSCQCEACFNVIWIYALLTATQRDDHRRSSSHSSPHHHIDVIRWGGHVSSRLQSGMQL